MKQKTARRWTVLDLGAPSALPQKVSLGTASSMREYTYEELREQAGAGRDFELDWHCVTGWTYHKLGLWGLTMRQVMDLAQVEPGKHEYLVQRAENYSASVVCADINDGFLALGLVSDDGEQSFPLPFEHGGVRLVFPSLFGWKSVKWVREIEFTNTYEDGFWEKFGCHRRGRVAYEERWQEGAAGIIWPILVKIHGWWDACGLYTWTMTSGSIVLGTMVRTWRKVSHQ